MTKTQVAVVTALVTSAFWILVGGGVAVGSFFLYRSFSESPSGLGDFSLQNDPPPFQVNIQYPAECAVGEEIRVEGAIGNPTAAALTVGSIDIYDTFLEGFDLVSFEGAADAGMPIMDFTTFGVGQSVDPGGELRFVVTLRAKTAGAFSGDLDVCDPDEDYVTQTLSVKVNP